MLKLHGEDHRRYLEVRRELEERIAAGGLMGEETRLHNLPKRSPADLSPALQRFADLIFDRFDVGESITTQEAADATGVAFHEAKKAIPDLRLARCWVYRDGTGRGWRRGGVA